MQYSTIGYFSSNDHPLDYGGKYMKIGVVTIGQSPRDDIIPYCRNDMLSMNIYVNEGCY